MKSDSVVDVLILQMGYADGPAARRAVVAEMAEARADLVEKLTDALPSLSGHDATMVCRALAILGPAAREALPTLEEVAGRRSMLLVRSVEAEAAERAIVAIRADDPALVFDALKSGRSVTRAGAVDAIADGSVDLSDEQAAAAAEILAGMLDAREADAAGPALRAICALGARAEPALPRIIELASASGSGGAIADIVFRPEFARALHVLGDAGLTTGPALAALLVDPNEMVRRVAVGAIRTVGPQSDEAVPALTRALKFESPPVVVEGLPSEVLEADGDLPEAAEAERLAHQIDVRATAAWALGERGGADEEALSALAQATRSTAARLRWHAVTALGRIGAADAEVAAALERSLSRDRAPHVRRAAARAIGLISRPGAQQVAALTQALEDVETRKSAAWALKQGGGAAAEATPALIAAFDANDRRRMVVAGALAAIGPEVMHDLRQGLHRDGRWQRIGCAEAVAAFGAEAQMMEATLRELLFDRREDVREAAQEALEAISGDDVAQLSEGESDE
ncbi:MAG: HEAT repeat domain-containing protein [Armatimonadota bacterium]